MGSLKTSLKGILIIFISFFLTLVYSWRAQGQDYLPGQAPTFQQIEENAPKIKHVDNSNLEFPKEMLGIPEVRSLYQQAQQKCQSSEGQQGEGQKQQGVDIVCVYESMQTLMDQMPAAQRKQLAKKYEEGLAKPKQPQADGLPTEAQMRSETIDGISKKRSKAYGTLTQYLRKRMQESFYGRELTSSTKKQNTFSRPQGPVKIANPEDFFAIYRGKLGNSIIESLTYFCLNSNSSMLFGETPEARKSIREDNLSKLGTTIGEGEQQSSAGFAHFSNCVRQLPDICKSSPSAYSKRMACSVQNNVRKLRQLILATQKIEKELKKNREHQSNQNVIASNVQGYQQGRGKGEKRIRDLATLTSGELAGQSSEGESGPSFLGELGADAANFQKNCAQGGNNPYCKKYFYSGNDQGEFQKGIGELTAKASVMAGKIAAFNEQELKQHLQQEGRSQAEIEKIFAANQGNIEAIKKQIKEELQAEKLAIIQQLKDDFMKRSPQQSEAGATQSLYAEMMEAPELLKANQFAANILQSEFEIKNSASPDKTSRNTESLVAELRNSIYDNRKNPQAQNGGGNNFFEQIKQNSQKNLGELNQFQMNQTEDLGLDVGQINQAILNNYIPRNQQGQPSQIPQTPQGR